MLRRFILLPLLAVATSSCIVTSLSGCLPLAVVTGVVGEYRFQGQNDRIKELENERAVNKKTPVKVPTSYIEKPGFQQEWSNFYDEWVKTRLKGPNKINSLSQ